MKSWKKYEKLVTAWWIEAGFLAKRISRGRRGEACEDVHLTEHNVSLEVKTRKNFPQYIRDWMTQVTKNAGDALPTVQWHEDNTGIQQDVIVLSIEDFAELVRRARGVDKESG